MTDRGLKIRETFRKKYGVDHPSQLPSVKEKIKQKRLSGSYENMVSKIKQTNILRHGSENYNNKEKGKKTKLEKYGDENYNNREKMIQTTIDKYGSKVSPKSLKSIIRRSNSGEVGFKSLKYKEFLESENVSNVSQIQAVKDKNKLAIRDKVIKHLFFGNRLKNIVTPLFSENEYIDSEYNTLYKFKCNTCNTEFEDILYSGNIPRCLTCFPLNRFKSAMEDEILEYLHSYNITTKHHDRTILVGNEIDILISEFKLGIEYDGIYWHSELSGKPKNYHITKTEEASKKGIELLHIWDWEWLNKKEIVKGIILSKIHKNKFIYAGKCEIREISNIVKSEFITDNHIQGDDKSSIRIGLYYNDELVSVMTFSKSRFDKKYQYELSRLCTKIGISVIGGASKLFTYFIRTYSPRSIVSYCDRRYFTGKSYSKMGMSLNAITPISYHYFHNNKGIPLNRLQFQKHKLKDKLSTFDPSLTEWENMQLNGYNRIWDCGMLKYTWNNPNIT